MKPQGHFDGSMVLNVMALNENKSSDIPMDVNEGDGDGCDQDQVLPTFVSLPLLLAES